MKDRLTDALAPGIDATATRVEAATALSLGGETAKRELDADRVTVDRFKRDIGEAGRLLNESSKGTVFDATLCSNDPVYGHHTPRGDLTGRHRQR